MVDKDELIKELNLERFTPEEQAAIFDDYTLELGAAVSDGLDEGQMEEFTQIINGNDEVIDSWLAAHAPDYREDPSFKELQVGYNEDPEKVPAEKAFASIRWIEVNRPDFVQVVERVKREFKAMLDAQSAA